MVAAEFASDDPSVEKDALQGLGSGSAPGTGRARPRGHSGPQIRDVAAAAGVSHQTVSRVLNDSPKVRPATRQVVLDAMERMRYRPSRTARALSTGRSGVITVVTANTVLYGYASVLQGVEEAARVRGLTVGVRVLRSDAAEEIQETVDHLSESSAGSAVVVAFDPVGVSVLRAVPASVPVVAVTQAGGVPGVDRPMIFLDEQEAAADATRYLLRLGHETVHLITIPSEPPARARQSGWRAALHSAGAEIPEVLSAGWDLRSAHEAGRRLAQDPSVTAILCGNDDLALAVRRALFEEGREVPGDVSIIGFDDVPGAAYWTPALTTVRMNFVALGHACVAALIGDDRTAVRLEPPRLIVRETTSPRSRPRGRR